MVDYWYGNNDLIYASDSTYFQQYSSGSYNKIFIGLEDLTELPGQSTMFVNKVHFRAEGEVVAGGLAGQSDGHMLAGVVPRDLVNSVDFDSLVDYQNYQAWPLKMSQKFYCSFASDPGNSINKISLSYTYTPRKALVLNREQVLVLGFHNDSGDDVSYMLSMFLQAKRGN